MMLGFKMGYKVVTVDEGHMTFSRSQSALHLLFINFNTACKVHKALGRIIPH
jgi:hypothetical protein